MERASPIALTMGEPAGIGGEITLKAWAQRTKLGLPAFFVIDDPKRLEWISQTFNWPIKITRITAPQDATEAFSHSLPVLEHALPGSITPGHPDPKNASSVIAAIDAAVSYVQSGAASAVVTNPIHKHTLYKAGFDYPGHTEYLAALAGEYRPVMMLACDELRAVPVTVHQSLQDAIRSLNTEDIIQVSKITAQALQSDFAITKPHLM
ncbi:MAG: 4-hydroxythreonine-4-phosphate dehydrogenase PdxA, partial [Proteobacteria bacterium]|nr:4-hydroxythreonine-4-phosphate dehydrogenase PdxA [Pseudomonadota bacterium]